MIILEGVPKHPTDPSTGPTNREPPEPDIEAQAPSSPLPSLNTTLPDYETSEAQHPLRLKQSGSQKFWYTRVGRLISYALVVYSVVVVVVGIPMFVMVSISFDNRVSNHVSVLLRIRNRDHTSSNGPQTMMILDPWARRLHGR
jgi:hypothetical protein